MKDLEDKEQKRPRDCKITDFKKFKIDTSTSPTKKAVWGQFTNYKMIKNSGNCTDVEGSIATNDYVEQYGLAFFDSNWIKESHLIETNECKIPGVWIRNNRTDPSELPYKIDIETEKFKKKYAEILNGSKF